MVDSPSPIIGIFDSGVGGLSVWREIVRQLPHAGTLYFADQAAEEILGFTRSITDFLLTQGAQIIVVACNTASGVALRPLRAAYPDVPFVGMEPAVKPAAEHTRNGRVGVIATPTTFQGALFKQLADRFGHDVEIHTQVCPGLVAAVEGHRHMIGLHFHELDAARRFAAKLNEAGLDISVQTYKTSCPPAALTKIPLTAGYEVADRIVEIMEAALAS